MKRFISLALAILLCITVSPLSALAADYTVGSGEEMQEKWNEASGNEDSSNVFTLTDDVDMSGRELIAANGKTYTISSESGSDHSIANVMLGATDREPGESGSEVIINADVVGNDQTALMVSGELKVDVNGNVEVSSESAADPADLAIIAASGASITVSGNVNSQEGGISSYQSEVVISGDVTLEGEGAVDAENHVLFATEDAKIIVAGDVVSDEAGIYAGESEVEIKGDLSAHEGGITAFGSEVHVYGDVYQLSRGDADGENYVITASSHSTLKIGSEVFSEEGGIYVSESDVTIGGSAAAKGQTDIYDGGSLDVGGDLICNPAGQDTAVSPGIYVYSSELSVGGDVETPFLSVCDSSEAKIKGSIKADDVYIGSYGEANDKTKVTCTNIMPQSDQLLDFNCTVIASGASHTTVLGHIRGELCADTEARVDVYGNIARIGEIADKAVVNVGLGFRPGYNINFSDTYYGEDITDPLTGLCIGYTPGSELFAQTLSLEHLLGEVSSDMNTEMNFWSALAPAISLKDDILQQDLLRLRDGALGMYSYINSGSLALLESALTVSGYDVSLYMANLHEVLKASEGTILDNYADCLESVSFVSEIVQDVFKAINGAEGAVNSEQIEYLKKIFESGDFTVTDAYNFFVNFGYFDGDLKKITKASQTMHDMFKFFEGLETSVDAVDKIFTVIDFADFWVRNYGVAAQVLDTMLSEQTLSPAMLLATIKLREEYLDKLIGTFRRADDLIMEGIWEKIESSHPLYLLVDTTVDLIALTTGLTKTGENLMNATALTGITPEFLQAYKNSILRVQNGDYSKEALALVRTNYSLLIRFLDAMCETMCELGDDSQQGKYESIRRELEDLEIGECRTFVS